MTSSLTTEFMNFGTKKNIRYIQNELLPKDILNPDNEVE